MKTIPINFNSGIFDDDMYSDEFCLYAYENNISAYPCTCNFRSDIIHQYQHVWLKIPNNILTLFLLKFNINVVQVDLECKFAKKFALDIEFIVKNLIIQ
jgi:hypothetical protein